MDEKKKKKKKKEPSLEKKRLKEEVAKELGLEDEIAQKGWSDLSSRQTGMIGARVARRLNKK